jgi:hypothetical protein
LPAVRFFQSPGRSLPDLHQISTRSPPHPRISQTLAVLEARKFHLTDKRERRPLTHHPLENASKQGKLGWLHMAKLDPFRSHDLEHTVEVILRILDLWDFANQAGYSRPLGLLSNHERSPRSPLLLHLSRSLGLWARTIEGLL